MFVILICLSATSPAAAARPRLIFVPGYYGTTLVDADTDRTVWLTVRELLFGDQSLRLCQSQLLFLGCRRLVHGKVYDEMAIVPSLFSIDIYGKALDAIASASRGFATFETFAYDWRDSADVAAARLRRQIASHSTPVYLVAHSFGGIVAARLLDQLAKAGVEGVQKQIIGVATIGTPFAGAATVMRNMMVGRTAQGTETLLDPVAFGSFPSAYEILPPRFDVVIDEDRRPFGRELEWGQTWEGHGWGVFSETLADDAAARRFVEEQLQTRRKFFRRNDQLLAWSTKTELLNFRSRALSAPSSIGWHRKEKRLIDGGGKSEPGDGTVTWESAALPKRYRILLSDEVELSGEHLAMLTEKTFIDRLRRHLATLLSSESSR